MSSPVYAAASARADKLLEPDGSIQTHTGTVVSGPSAAGAAQYSNAAARADKLLQPDGSIITSGSGGGGSTPPGGAAGQVQYNNAGVFAGAAGVVTDGNVLAIGQAVSTAPLTLKNTVGPNNPILLINKTTGAAGASISFNEVGNYATFNLGAVSVQAQPSTWLFTGGHIQSYGGYSIIASPNTGSAVAMQVTNTAASVTANYFQVTTNGQPAGDILSVNSSGITTVKQLGVATAPVTGAICAIQTNTNKVTFPSVNAANDGNLNIGTSSSSGFAHTSGSGGLVLSSQNGVKLGYVGANQYSLIALNYGPNYMQITGAAAGISGPAIYPAGSDANLNMNISAKGTGVIVHALASVPVYANNAAAVGGGLSAGSVYRTGADPDQLCIVH